MFCACSEVGFSTVLVTYATKKPKDPAAPCHQYQCADAMALAARLKEAPLLVATKVVEHMRLPNSLVTNVTVEKPGFLCIFIAKRLEVHSFARIDIGMREALLCLKQPWCVPTAGRYFASRLHAILDSGLTAPILHGPPKHVLVDYSSPNIAKEMHVGHLRYVQPMALLPVNANR